jgi:hypothetical protein
MREVGANLYVYRLDAEFYPSFQLPALQGEIGFVASYEGAAAGSVKDADYNGTYPLTHSEVYGGVRIRHATPRYVIGANVMVGRLSSGLDDHGAAHTPDISYTEVRSALDATFQLPRGVRVRGSAGFRVPLAYGQLSDEDWFPHVGGYGFDVGLDAEYPLSRNVALTARSSLRRYVLEMNSQPEDASGGFAETAGGAVDSYLAGYLGVIVGL